MYSDEDLDKAVDAGVLSADAVRALREYIASQRRSEFIDEEHFRLVSGFNDIFVVIASLLLLASVSWLGKAIAPWLGPLAVSAAAWLLAEFFVLKRRMALPAIVLLGAFVGGVFFAGLRLFGETGSGPAIASALAAGAALAHWLRFHVPITVAAGVGALIGTCIATLLALAPQLQDWAIVLVFVAGIASFFYALHWDASDARRQTRRSDVAFWLHLLAAPMLVHPVFAALGVFSKEPGTLQTLAVVALYIGIGIASLAIDRRALMVSALAYVLYAFSALLKSAGMVSLNFALTALIIGSALLLLSAFWHRSRSFALRLLPEKLRAHLPPAQ